MKKATLGAAVVSLLIGTPVLAADMVVKAPPPASPPVVAPFDWTGFYVGGNIGYGWAKPTVTSPTTGAPIGAPLPSPTGFLGGIQGGYNYQVGVWVLGVELDYTWTDVKGTADCVALLCTGANLHLFGYPDRFGTLTGRLGYAFDRLLIYGKGGFSLMHESFEQTGINGNLLCVPTCKGTNENTGWTAGGGAEYGLSRNWSLRAEYDFMTDLNKKLTVLTNSIGQQIVFNETRAIQKVTVGLNYRF